MILAATATLMILFCNAGACKWISVPMPSWEACRAEAEVARREPGYRQAYCI